MSYLEIDSNTEEGFQDLVFNIESYWNDENGNHIMHARGSFRGELVGFKVMVKTYMKSGVIGNEIDNTAFYPEGITLISVGQESNNFIKAISNLYGIVCKEEKMIDEIKLTSFALGGNPEDFKNEELKFKVFYDDANSYGLYSEFYININLDNRFLEFMEKDTRYRKNILGAFTSKRPNVFKKLYKRAFNKV